jgi:hypothetical protein
MWRVGLREDVRQCGGERRGEATGAEEFYVPSLFSTSFFLVVEIMRLLCEIQVSEKKMRKEKENKSNRKKKKGEEKR